MSIYRSKILIKNAMANAFFRLRKVKAKTPQIIYAGYKFGKDQLIYSTGLKVTPDYWNFKNTRVKHVLSNPHPNRDLINKKLDNIEKLSITPPNVSN